MFCARPPLEQHRVDEDVEQVRGQRQPRRQPVHEQPEPHRRHAPRARGRTPARAAGSTACRRPAAGGGCGASARRCRGRRSSSARSRCPPRACRRRASRPPATAAARRRAARNITGTVVTQQQLDDPRLGQRDVRGRRAPRSSAAGRRVRGRPVGAGRSTTRRHGVAIDGGTGPSGRRRQRSTPQRTRSACSARRPGDGGAAGESGRRQQCRRTGAAGSRRTARTRERADRRRSTASSLTARPRPPNPTGSLPSRGSGLVTDDRELPQPSTAVEWTDLDQPRRRHRPGPGDGRGAEGRQRPPRHGDEPGARWPTCSTSA